MSCGIMIGIYVAEHCNNIIIINTRLFPCQNRTRETRDLFSKIMKKKSDVAFVDYARCRSRLPRDDFRGEVEKNKSGNANNLLSSGTKKIIRGSNNLPCVKY